MYMDNGQNKTNVNGKCRKNTKCLNANIKCVGKFKLN